MREPPSQQFPPQGSDRWHWPSRCYGYREAQWGEVSSGFCNVKQEGWAPKNWCFWTAVLKKTLKNPLDSKEIRPVNPNRNQPWTFTGRSDAEAEGPILWPPDVKSWLTGKDPDAGKDWRQEKGMTEREMAGWHHWLNGHGFGWTPGVGDGQGGLACCSPWGCKESDTTERLNNKQQQQTYKMERRFAGLQAEQLFPHGSPTPRKAFSEPKQGWLYLLLGFSFIQDAVGVESNGSLDELQWHRTWLYLQGF